MKKSLLTFILFFIISAFFGQENWSPIGLNIAGQNKLNGLEASYQLSKCHGKDAVVIKLINHNAEPLVIEWNPAVFTKDIKWISKDAQEDKIQIILKGNSEITGDCAATTKGMMIYLADFSVKAEDFRRYGMYNLNFYKK
ncbi:MAG: hypothetical protein ACXVNQ_05635 [Bacteroidia bacterium]